MDDGATGVDVHRDLAGSAPPDLVGDPAKPGGGRHDKIKRDADASKRPVSKQAFDPKTALLFVCAVCSFFVCLIFFCVCRLFHVLFVCVFI